MKKLITPIAALVLAFIAVGCSSTNPNIGPALLRFSVYTAASYELSQNTNAIAGVRLGKDVICAAANGTNVSPAQIVEDINALASLSPDEVFILRAAVGAYTLIYNGTPEAATNTAAIQPYLAATCAGLEDALPTVTARGKAIWNRNAPPAVAWPQVKFRK